MFEILRFDCECYKILTFSWWRRIKGMHKILILKWTETLLKNSRHGQYTKTCKHHLQKVFFFKISLKELLVKKKKGGRFFFFLRSEKRIYTFHTLSLFIENIFLVGNWLDTGLLIIQSRILHHAIISTKSFRLP